MKEHNASKGFVMRHKNRLANKLYMRQYRSSRPAEKCKHQRARDNLRKRLRRKNMTESQTKLRREKEKIYRAKLRSKKRN
ncbi:Activating transcription factor 7-interacting protein 1 [Frankliniella fusca]|uniref:Activating transcription factor 7-interacting protein 1 n=1 Tax=Frankliniella fusca TaxID=407009 RepID=A0AAE1GWE0_9NEOP|nr:Activating transcription factor 7-interacting protein 1 [Frankliniella fusca]